MMLAALLSFGPLLANAAEVVGSSGASEWIGGGGLGLAGASVGLIIWQMTKGEPRRRAELISTLNEQEERAVAERDRMRQEAQAREAALRDEASAREARLMDRMDNQQTELARLRGVVERVSKERLTNIKIPAIKDDDT